MLKDVEDQNSSSKQILKFKLSKVIDGYKKQKENLIKNNINPQGLSKPSELNEIDNFNHSPSLRDLTIRKNSLPPLPLHLIGNKQSSRTIDYDKDI